MKQVVVANLDKELASAQRCVEMVISFPDGIKYSGQARAKPFVGGYVRADFCLRWLWLNWLSETQNPAALTAARDAVVYSRALQQEIPDRYFRGRHDSYCVHLAASAGMHDVLPELAERLAWAQDSSELHQRAEEAWSGLWRFILLGDKPKAKEQAEILYSAHRPMGVRLPRKPLVKAWLDEDWKAFRQAQKKSFKQLWDHRRKAIWRTDAGIRSSILKEDDNVVELVLYDTLNSSWQENGIALHLRHQGIEIETDPLWLPVSALR